MAELALFATAPRGLEALLADELTALGADGVRPRRAGVAFSGDLATAYRACLRSRVASRVLVNIARFAAPDPDALYAAVREMPWEEHLDVDGTLAVDATVARSPIGHSQFAALRVKDAVVDRFRDLTGRRPSVSRERPSLRLNLVLQGTRAVLSIDLAGDALHRRGYRPAGAVAPLKENLAAALLLLAGWPEIAAGGGALVDPLCGSGTLAIEAALIASGTAPGLLRDYFGFDGWLGHVPVLWREVRDAAAAEVDRSRVPPIAASDRDGAVLAVARRAAAAAGVSDVVTFARVDLSDLQPPPNAASGLVITNPPYGARLQAAEGLGPLHAELGRLLRARFPGWHAAVLAGDERLSRRLSAVRPRSHALFNGALPVTLLDWKVPDRGRRAGTAQALAPAGHAADGARQFADRLRKNLRRLRRWAAREGVESYRLYDADLPEFSFAVDLYGCTPLHARVQEYAPPPEIDPARAEARRVAALAAIAEVLELAPDAISYRLRARQRGSEQYVALADAPSFREVREGPVRLLVDFDAHLDTGLFLDHRPTRRLVGELAAGRRFLNLFAYTGSATVHAAAAGAVATTSVDLSSTYLDWAEANLALNGFAGEAHELVRADCLAWIDEAVRRRRIFGLVLIDPPTFSNSKRLDGDFDVQRDHVRLIRGGAELLAPGGVLLFSTNFRRFRLDEGALAGLTVDEISRQTVPEDFRRNPRIHRCWRITVNDG